MTGLRWPCRTPKSIIGADLALFGQSLALSSTAGIAKSPELQSRIVCASGRNLAWTSLPGVIEINQALVVPRNARPCRPSRRNSGQARSIALCRLLGRSIGLARSMGQDHSGLRKSWCGQNRATPAMKACQRPARVLASFHSSP